MKAPSSVRVLGACGLVSAALSIGSGFFGVPILLGIAGMVMFFGNVYAIGNRS